jgi:hypothetical protein
MGVLLVDGLGVRNALGGPIDYGVPVLKLPARLITQHRESYNYKSYPFLSRHSLDMT